MFFPCLQNTWTHDSSELKRQVQTSWRAPSDFSGVIQFFATVVADKNHYTPNIQSEKMYFNQGQLVNENEYETHSDNSQSQTDQAEKFQGGNGLPYHKCDNFVCTSLSDSMTCLKDRNCDMIFLGKFLILGDFFLKF